RPSTASTNHARWPPPASAAHTQPSRPPVSRAGSAKSPTGASGDNHDKCEVRSTKYEEEEAGPSSLSSLLSSSSSSSYFVLRTSYLTRVSSQVPPRPPRCRAWTRTDARAGAGADPGRTG